MTAPGARPFTTCDLYDAHGDALQVVAPLFRSFGGVAVFSGEIVTVRCFEDNSRVKELLATDGPGKVLVVDGGGSLRCALLGDLIAKSAVAHGWQGVIVHAAVRDIATLRELPLGVLALAATPRKSVRNGQGTVGEVLEIGGASFMPGHRVYADEDGIVLAAAPLRA